MLSTAVKEIRAGAVSVATASQQLASVSANITQRTDTQASTLEETSPSMQELSSTIEQNSGSAHQANELATGGAVAVAGCNIVEQVVATMKGTRESSEKISEIIGLIAGIAF
jgi:methyl-accepting chemotaxis protein